jgi:ABC-2 type transport system permease protein
MNKTLLVLRNEIMTVISRPSFWFAVLGIPLIGALIFAVVGALNQNSRAADVVGQLFSGPKDLRAEGYVDQSGIIRRIPESIPPGALAAFPDEAAARRALDSGEIAAFYIVPDDYLHTGEIAYVRPDFNPLTGRDQSALFRWVVRVNLAGGDEMLANLVNGPLEIEEVSLAAEPQRDEDNPLTFWVPYAVTIIFYAVILGAASLLLNSVSKEKENRVIEILMMSVTPRQLLAGKILGLGVVGLLQTVIWVGAGYTLMNLSGQTFSLPAAFQLPASFLAWGIVFFLLGYTVYASLMAGLGALVPNLREATQATIVVIFPLIIPMFLISVLIEEPHGALAVGLSLFPLTAPVAMMTRLSAGGVPLWQPALAAGLLAVTAALIVRAAAGMFRAQALLSGQAFNLKVYFMALLVPYKSNSCTKSKKVSPRRHRVH